jgi:hypothetical protein
VQIALKLDAHQDAKETALMLDYPSPGGVDPAGMGMKVIFLMNSYATTPKISGYITCLLAPAESRSAVQIKQSTLDKLLDSL